MLDTILGPEILAEELPPGTPIPPGIRVRRSRWLTRVAGRLTGMRAPVAAVTLGRTIVMAPGARLTARLLRHELAHVRQWERTPLFPLRYALEHLRQGYIDNPYEVEARAAESQAADTTPRNRSGR